MENLNLELIEQFLMIENEIVASADHVAIAHKGIFDEEDSGGITSLTTRTY